MNWPNDMKLPYSSSRLPPRSMFVLGLLSSKVFSDVTLQSSSELSKQSTYVLHVADSARQW